MVSYLRARIFPIFTRKNLEDFFINRFGKELYKTFSKNIPKKVWGISCTHIQPEWGAQRIKGISLTKSSATCVAKMASQKETEDIRQKKTETSLIGKFLYPKFGPGQMWEETARIVRQRGGEIRMKKKVVELQLHPDKKRFLLSYQKTKKPENERLLKRIISLHHAHKDLVYAWKGNMPKSLRNIGEKLVYRDFLTVGLLLKN